MSEIKYFHIPECKETRFNNAVSAIKFFLDNMDMTMYGGTAPSTTNSYKKFREEVDMTGKIVVSEEGCEKTIYDDPHYNHLARYWHDMIHYKEDFDFSIKSESIVAERQRNELGLFLDRHGWDRCIIKDAVEIIYHDIVGQAEYYESTKEFLDDQKAFVYERFLK